MQTLDIDTDMNLIKPRKKNYIGFTFSADFQWWKRPSGVAAVCLGLLCVLLLAGIIGLSVYYNNLTKERDQLQTSYNTLTKERDQLQTSYNTLTKERDQLHTSYNTLTKERDQLQTSYNTLTKERDQLQTSYNTLTKERDQLQTSYNTLTKERDNLKEEPNLQNIGWRKFKSSWYFLSTEKKSWTESRQDCLRRGAHLVVINSREEQEFIYKWTRNTDTYLGFHDTNTEGVWEWIKDDPLDQSPAPGTTYWRDGEPNDEYQREDCALLSKMASDPLKSWNDIPCTMNIHWMCEKTAVLKHETF